MEKFGYLSDTDNKQGLSNINAIKNTIFAILMFGSIQGCSNSVDINELTATVEKIEKLGTSGINQKELYGTSGCSSCGPVHGTISGETFGLGEMTIAVDYYKITLSNGKVYKTGNDYKVGQRVALKYFLVEIK